MIIVSSLSPGHGNKDNQHQAIFSWQQHGQCYSMNNSKEIDILKDEYVGIEFVETTVTMEHIFGKPLVSISAMIEFAKSKMSDVLLINSDIIIDRLPLFEEDGITIFSRYDYIEHFEDATMFENGFDAFYIPYKFLNLFPESIYVMGNCYWDYVIPYIAILNNIPVYYPTGKYIFHKTHPVQYQFSDYVFLGEHFRDQFLLDKSLSASQVAIRTLALIRLLLISK